MKSGGEVNDQLTVNIQFARSACDDTIHSRFFHGIECPLVCSSINLFATNDNGIKNSFRCCSIKVSADNDKGRFDASSLGGLADVCTDSIELTGGGVGCEQTNFRQFSRGFQEQLDAL